MPSKQSRRRERAVATENRNFGAAVMSVRASSVNEEERSIEAQLSSETPVMMFDYERWEYVPEVLLTGGADFPKSRQVPLLDSHNRYQTSDQLGSTRNISKGDEGLVGRLFFGETERAADAWKNVRDGHVTDVSVGYEIRQKRYVPAKTTEKIGGREFTGPVNVVTKWRLREVSVTPIGADELAKMRGFNPSAPVSTPKERFMNEELKALLVARGMPTDADDATAQEWLARYLKEQPKPEEKKERQAGTDGDDLSGKIAEAARKAAAEALKQESERRAAFRSEIDGLLEVADMSDLASRAHACTDIAEVRKLIKDERAKRAESPVRIVPGAAQRDKHESGIRTALVLNALTNTNARQDTIDRLFPKEQRSEYGDHFRRASLFELARESVEALGVRTMGLTREQVAMAAMGFYRQAGIEGRSGGAYHTTANFPNITLDAINKSMMVGYTEAPSTWRGPMRQAASVPDFKQIHRIRLGAVPNLPVWPDNTNPEQASFADAKESYAVEARSLELSFSYRSIVNDDMEVLSRGPQMFGAAATRTQNAVAWSQWTSNPTMSDGVALFAAATGNRKRTNLTTGAVSDYTAAINTMTNLMMQMRGENTPEGNEGPDVLSLMPRYIIFPGALRGTLLQLVGAEWDPNKSIPGVPNINRGLIPVMEPLLDANSTTAFYLSADTSQIDTVEVTFLLGQETPVVRDYMDDRKLSQNYAVLQTFAAKAMNHRGIQKHAGA